MFFLLRLEEHTKDKRHTFEEDVHVLARDDTWFWLVVNASLEHYSLGIYR